MGIGWNRAKKRAFADDKSNDDKILNFVFKYQNNTAEKEEVFVKYRN